MKKHSRVCYILKKNEFLPIREAKLYENSMGLDLFSYNSQIYEGRTGCSISADSASAMADVLKRCGDVEGIKAIVLKQLERTGESPRYTRPTETKKEVFNIPNRDKDVIIAKNIYNENHCFRRIYDEDNTELFVLKKATESYKTVFAICEDFMVDVGQETQLTSILQWLKGLENGVKGEIEKKFNECVSNPISIVELGFARILGRYDEAIAHNAPIIAMRKEENRKSDELRNTNRLAKEQVEKDKYSKAIKDAEDSIIKREKLFDYEINGKSLVMQLFREHGIDVPIKTQGWIIKSLYDVYYNTEYEKWSYHYQGNQSTVFMDYFSKLVVAIEKKKCA